MSTFSIEKDIIPVSTFNESEEEYLSSLAKNQRSLVLTKDGKATAVLVSPEEYDRLQDNKNVLNLIASRLQEISDDKFIDDETGMWKELGV